MGNSNEATGKFQWGYIILQLDTPFVYSGGDLTGTINLKLDAMYPAARLDIQIKGREHVSWTERESH